MHKVETWGGRSNMGLHAQEPLPAGEFRHALAVGVGSEYLNANNISPKGTPLDCCQGLITVDKEASAPVDTSHPSRVSFHPLRSCWRGSFDCRRTLPSPPEFSVGQGPLSRPVPQPQSTPSLKYTMIYRGTHIIIESLDGANLLTLELFN